MILTCSEFKTFKSYLNKYSSFLSPEYIIDIILLLQPEEDCSETILYHIEEQNIGIILINIEKILDFYFENVEEHQYMIENNLNLFKLIWKENN